MESETVNVVFGEADVSNVTDNTETNNNDESTVLHADNDTTANDSVDLSKYTVIDHLDEDTPIEGQQFALFSFLSPEGVMNCNVRAVKFRGAYPTLEKAEEAARKLESSDKYFKIFIGETGKWLDFDPPSSKVEREMSSNKEHQKILDAQRKQRMDKINALAGKYKETMDKKDSTKKQRIEESKKAGAASSAVEKHHNANTNANANTNTNTSSSTNTNTSTNASSNQSQKMDGRSVAREKQRERLRRQLQERQNKRNLEKLEEKDKQEQTNNQLKNKVTVVNKASAELGAKKAQLEAADKNIEKIKQLMASRNTSK